MKPHALSPDDHQFRAEFEAGTFPPYRFDHRAHLRLSYAYLVDHDTETAHVRLRAALLNYLEHQGIDQSKFHETMTRAWVGAVRHFMEESVPAASADAFIDANPALLDSGILLTHYSRNQLFSPEARRQLVEPDLDPIPRHEP